MNTTETSAVNTGTTAPVLMDRLDGGKGIVRVGAIVTPKHNPGPAWTVQKLADYSLSGDTRLQAAVKYADGREGSAWVENLLLTSHSELQAVAQLESVKEMVQALADSKTRELKDGETRSQLEDDAMEAIQQDALSVQVRSDWVDLNQVEQMDPAEFCILLCTGGPAVRIIGTLNKHGEPESAQIEHQDWGTTWTALRISGDDEAALLAYASEFCFAS